MDTTLLVHADWNWPKLFRVGQEEESRGCHSSTIPINLEDQAFTGALRRKNPEIAREPPEPGEFHRR